MLAAFFFRTLLLVCRISISVFLSFNIVSSRAQSNENTYYFTVKVVIWSNNDFIPLNVSTLNIVRLVEMSSQHKISDVTRTAFLYYIFDVKVTLA